MTPKTVRQSVSLRANGAVQVRTMANRRRLSSNRMLVELIENRSETEKRKPPRFFELVERFRYATGPEGAKRLGDELDGLWQPMPRLAAWAICRLG